MLRSGVTYSDNSGRSVRIGERIEKYSDKLPFVVSAAGDWYDEQTGEFVAVAADGPQLILLASHPQSIANHEGKV